MIRKIIQNFIKIVQKIVITVSLVIVYIFGIGITLIFIIIFNRRLLGITEGKRDTFWRDAEGYNSDISECLRES